MKFVVSIQYSTQFNMKIRISFSGGVPTPFLAFSVLLLFIWSARSYNGCVKFWNLRKRLEMFFSGRVCLYPRHPYLAWYPLFLSIFHRNCLHPSSAVYTNITLAIVKVEASFFSGLPYQLIEQYLYFEQLFIQILG